MSYYETFRIALVYDVCAECVVLYRSILVECLRLIKVITRIEMFGC